MDRRDFVKLSGLGVVGSLLPNSDIPKLTINFDGIMAIDKNKLLGVLPVPGHMPALIVMQAGNVVHKLSDLRDIEIDAGMPVFDPAVDLSKAIDFNAFYPNQILSLDRIEGMQFIKLPLGSWGCRNWSGQTWAFHSGDRLMCTQKIYKFYCEVPLVGQDITIGRIGARRKFSLTGNSRVNILISNIPKDLRSASPDHFAHYYEIIKEKVPQFVPSLLSASYAPFPRFCEPVVFSESELPLA